MKNPLKKRGQIVKGMKTNQVFNPLIMRSMSYKVRGRGGTLERTPSLKKPSPTIITHLEIKVTCACCNAIDIFSCKMNAKSKEKGF
jgi:hypothetical protein